MLGTSTPRQTLAFKIGVRTAVGAMTSDIPYQFLIEAVLVCLIGGALGVAHALSVG